MARALTERRDRRTTAHPAGLTYRVWLVATIDLKRETRTLQAARLDGQQSVVFVRLARGGCGGETMPSV